jgi:hypothetical protein
MGREGMPATADQQQINSGTNQSSRQQENRPKEDQ